MKRKIAILLATTMTLTAAPLYAAKVTAPSLEGGQTTVASSEAISVLPTNFDKPVYEVVLRDKVDAENYRDALRKRDAVLKLGVDRLSTEDIKAGDKFTIKLENGKFENILGSNPKEFAYRNVAVNGAGEPVQFYVKPDGRLYKKVAEKPEVEVTTTSFGEMIKGLQFDVNSVKGANGGAIDGANIVASLSHIPYSINIIDETTAEVTFLTSITDDDINKDLQKFPTYYDYTPKGTASNGNPIEENLSGKNQQVGYFAIPLGAVKSTGGEEVKASILGFKSTITSGTVTLAKTVGNGSTYIDKTYVKKQIFEDRTKATDLYIRENTKDSLKAGEQISLRLSNGFKFESVAKVTESINLNNNKSIIDGTPTISEDKNLITFRLANVSKSDKENIKIGIPPISAIDENKNYGEVSLEVYGAGVTDESVVIAERTKLGFKLETKSEIPTITKGRYSDLNSNINSKENITAEIELSETVADSLTNRRNLEFTVPEGVKIADVLDINTTSMGIVNSDNDEAFSIINDGTTLRLQKNRFNPDSSTVSKLRLKLKLSIDIGFQGEEVKLVASGAGIPENVETVIAKVQNPFVITAVPKNINTGYQDYAVNDIVITETKPGMFIQGEELVVSLVAPYGTHEMGFTRADVKVTSGDLELYKTDKDKYENLSKNSIVAKVKYQSRKEPSTITISNVRIGTTRSVPFGAYDLSISGRAVVNNDLLTSNDLPLYNYSIEELGKSLSFKLKKVNESSKDKIKRIDAEHGNYAVNGYVNISTNNSTVSDKVMKVTIGSKTAVIGDKEVVMDVAPYLQTGTNAGNTMVPLRFVAVALTGGDASSVEAAQNSSNIQWDATSKTITIFSGTSNQKIIQFRIGDRYMTVDGTKIAMTNGAKAEIKDGRTFVPFRSLGIALGVSVDWDATTKTAIFNQ